MVSPVERETLRRLGYVKLLVGLACLVAAGPLGGGMGQAAAALLSTPGLLGAAVAAGGALLLVASVLGRTGTRARTAAMVLEFGVIGALFGGARVGLPEPAGVPPDWDPVWTVSVVLVVTALNGAVAPPKAAAAAAAAGAATAWFLGFPLVGALAAAALASVALVAAPLRRASLPPDLPVRLADAAQSGAFGAAATSDAPPLGEHDLRAAAASLGTSDIAVLVHDTSRRQRSPSGDLHVLRGGRYAVHRVPLDARPPEQAEPLGFHAPPGMRLSPQSHTKPLNGQSGALGRVILPAWPQPERSGVPTAREALLALLAATWSLRLDNHRLVRDAEAHLLDMVESLITSVEAKDPYTSGHSKRVCKYSLLLGETLGVSGRELDEIGIGAALHDVGKLGVPEQILSKPAKLDDAEFSVVRAHPKVGARIIDSFNQSQAVVDIIFHHHERFDGGGYPAGLAGEVIPYQARIVGVADALDAMTSGRAYQRNRSVRDALEEIRRHAGRQFDPKIVQALLRMPIARLEAIAPAVPVEPAPPVAERVPLAPARPPAVAAAAM